MGLRVKNKNLKSIGYQIIVLRKANNMTQKQLAKIAGMSRHHLARLETGEFMPTFNSMIKITEALNAELSITFKAQDIYEKNKIKNGRIERELFTDGDEL